MHPQPYSRLSPLALFNALQFEASMRLSDDPEWRVRCAIELERYEVAVKLADGILAQRQSGDLLARKALALESLDCDVEIIRELNHESVRQGSLLGTVGLSRLASTEGDHERANSLLDPIIASPCARLAMQGRLLRMQCLVLLGRDAGQVSQIKKQMQDDVVGLPLYDAVYVLIFLLKMEYFTANSVSARYLLSVLDAMLADVPLCRFHRTFACLRNAVEKDVPPKLSLNGNVSATEYKKKTVTPPPSIANKPTLAALFEILVAAGDHGADKSAIAAGVWGLEYNLLRHDARLYKSMERLKRGIEGSGWVVKAVNDRWVVTQAGSQSQTLSNESPRGSPVT